MSTKEEEHQVYYGHRNDESDESDEDDELLGCRDDGDDVIVTSSKHRDDHTSPSGVHMDEYHQYDHELDYDEVIETDHGRSSVTRKSQVTDHSEFSFSLMKTTEILKGERERETKRKRVREREQEKEKGKGRG